MAKASKTRFLHKTDPRIDLNPIEEEIKTLKETIKTLQESLDALKQEVKQYQDQAKMNTIVIHNRLVELEPKSKGLSKIILNRVDQNASQKDPLQTSQTAK